MSSPAARVVVASDRVVDRGLELVERVFPTRNPGVVKVCTETGHFIVRAQAHAVVCECAGFASTSVCSHVIAAQVYWYEEERADRALRGEAQAAEAELDADLADALGAGDDGTVVLDTTSVNGNGHRPVAFDDLARPDVAA